MNRRKFLQHAAELSARTAAGSVLLSGAFLKLAGAAPIPLDELQAAVATQDGLVLLPSNPKFAAQLTVFNKRTQVTPAVIVVCNNPQAVASAIYWARAHQVPIRIRAGGHSYEGLSLGTGLVIDVRGMTSIDVDPDAGTARVGAGASLSQVYEALYAHKLTIPAGSCPTVGVTGHALGGGFGFLARKFGLACDHLRAVELVNADGELLTADETQNSDLLWACRGGGGGSFGVVTALTFDLCPIDQVTTFSLRWNLDAAHAARLFAAWQAWAPTAPDELTCVLTFSKISATTFALACSGQYVGEPSALTPLLKPLQQVAPPAGQSMTEMAFIDAAHHFAGGHTYPVVQLKGKSDYVLAPMSDEGIAMIFKQLSALPPGGAGLIVDAYGGAINRVARDATAFRHREGTLYSIQYFSQWINAADTPTRLKWIRGLYDAMRPYVSGYSYLNYCDLDLPNWQDAYFGENFDRLTQIKATYDRGNVFNHALSIPVAAG